MPQDNWNPRRADPWPFSKEARDFFDSKTIRVMNGDHKWNEAHAEYNRRVSAAIERYLAENPKIALDKMTKKEAKKLDDTVVTNNPEVQDFINKMIQSNLRVRTYYPMWEEGQ